MIPKVCAPTFLSCRLPFWLGTCVVLLPALALAQLPQARLTSAFPPGGQTGTTVDVTITGQDLDSAQALEFSHPGLTAEPKLAEVDGKSQPVAGQFRVHVGENVPPGLYDVRARGKFGLSNPRTFAVGRRVEVRETEPNNTRDKAQVVELETVVNGRSEGGADLDWYRFTGRAGARILCDLRARRIDSRMSPSLELFDPSGRKIASSHHQVRRDALLDITCPTDGEYFLRIADFVYGNGPEYFYRLTIHTGPYIDFVLPASGLPGTTSPFTLYGRNLPGGAESGIKIAGRPLEQLTVSIALPADSAQLQLGEQPTAVEAGIDCMNFALDSPKGTSNAIPIYFASAPVAVESEPNDTPAQAQKLTIPIELTGQFQSRGDGDMFSFEAAAGETYWIEVFGQRDGTTADPFFVLDQVKVNDKGEETTTRITAQDDTASTAGAPYFNTNSDDPQFKFTVPANGTYRVTVRDRYFESRGDPTLVYRLAIRREQPDFRLVVIPTFPGNDQNQITGIWSLGLRKGDNVGLHVIALRRDAFAGPIEVAIEGLPPGVACPSVTLGGTQTSGNLVLSSSEDVAEWSGPIRVIGRARADDPAAVKAVSDAEAALKAATAAVPPLEKKLQETNTPLQAAQQAFDAAKAAAEKTPGDANLAQAAAKAGDRLKEAQTVAEAAREAKETGERKQAEATAAVTAAQQARDKAARELVREGRGGTIIWGGVPGQNVAPQARLSQAITLSILPEAAPYQAVTPTAHFVVNQGRQLLVPLKLTRRNGFDGNVNITFANPPQNLQVENKPINKGTDEQTYRLLVAGNVAPGTYSLFVQTQTQVSYSRNPEVAAAAAKDKEAADAEAKTAAELAKQTTDSKAAAEKSANEAAEAAKKSIEARNQAEQQLKSAQSAAEAAQQELARKAKEAADAAAAAGDSPDDKKAELTEAAKKSAEAQAAAEKKAGETTDQARKASEAKAESDRQVAAAEAAARQAVEQKTAADKAATEAAQKSQAATNAKNAADKRATDTANASKPQNVNTAFPAASLTIEVKPAPGSLVVNVPNGGMLKRGDKIAIKATLNRSNGFNGPAKLCLPLPPGVVGLTAAEVEIPADQKEATLMIEAGGDAPLGDVPNLVIQAKMDFNGAAAIDQPIAIKVNQ